MALKIWERSENAIVVNTIVFDCEKMPLEELATIGLKLFELPNEAMHFKICYLFSEEQFIKSF